MSPIPTAGRRFSSIRDSCPAVRNPSYNGVYLRARRVPDKLVVGPLSRNGQHARRNSRASGITQCDEAKECAYCRKADVASSDTIASTSLECVAEREDDGRIQICDAQRRRLSSCLFPNELEQKPERIAIAGDRLSTDPLVLDEVIGEGSRRFIDPFFSRVCHARNSTVRRPSLSVQAEMEFSSRSSGIGDLFRVVVRLRDCSYKWPSPLTLA